MLKGLKAKLSNHFEEVRQANRDAHQRQEHLTDEEMAQPDAMKNFAAFKKNR